MVVGPLSCLQNWHDGSTQWASRCERRLFTPPAVDRHNEFKKWAPSIPSLVYHGSKEERTQMRGTHYRKGDGSMLLRRVPTRIPVDCRRHEDDPYFHQLPMYMAARVYVLKEMLRRMGVQQTGYDNQPGVSSVPIEWDHDADVTDEPWAEDDPETDEEMLEDQVTLDAP